MPNAFFADLVRETCQEGGTGPLTPTGAVPGHRRFADIVPADISFHYAVAGIGQPNQWETGLGHLDAAGRLVRDSVAASSAGGARVDFAPGLKTIALTVGAGWFAASDAARLVLDAGLTELAAALDARQPLSTSHAEVATGAADDLVTVRRAGGWVNVPLATLPFRDAAGRHEFGGALSAPDGAAAAPAIGFAGDPDTGLFHPGSDVLAFAAAGSERMRIGPDGSVGVGTSAPAEFSGYRSLHLKGTTSAILLTEDGSGNIAEINVGPTNGVIVGSRTGHLNFSSGDGTPKWRVASPGALLPLADNSHALGGAGNRAAVLYAGTGTINTSDARDKSWRGAATAAELAAARRVIGELGFFQWNDAVAAKGADGARYHFGVRAQAVWDIMADEGLCAPAAAAPCAQPYAFLCHDIWQDKDSGELRSRYGVRSDQLALFLIAAQETRIAMLESGA